MRNSPKAHRIPRFLLPELPFKVGTLVDLPDAIAHQMSQVLRAGKGDFLYLFNGDGNLWLAQFEPTGKKTAQAHIIELAKNRPAEELTLILAPALIKGDRFEWLLEKATELGVSIIQPIETARSIVRVSEGKASGKLERWQKIISESCEQCERLDIPKLNAPCSLDDLKWDAGTTPILLMERGDRLPVRDVLHSSGKHLLIVGPEGGFTDEECANLQGKGAIAVSLGDRILRAETAGAAILSLFLGL